MLEISENAKLSGHKNHAQKINYVERLKEQLINADKVCRSNSFTATTEMVPTMVVVNSSNDSSFSSNLTTSPSPRLLDKSALSLSGEQGMKVEFRNGGKGVHYSKNVQRLAVLYDEKTVSRDCADDLSSNSQWNADNVRPCASPQYCVSPSNKWNLLSTSFSQPGPVVSTPGWSSRRESTATMYMTCRSRLSEIDAINDEASMVVTERSTLNDDDVSLTCLAKADQTLALSHDHTNDIETLKKEWPLTEVARSRARRLVRQAVEKHQMSDSVSQRIQNGDKNGWPCRLSFSLKRDAEQS